MINKYTVLILRLTKLAFSISDLSFSRVDNGNVYEASVKNPKLGDVKVADFIVDENFQKFLDSGQYTNTVKNNLDMKMFWKNKILDVDMKNTPPESSKKIEDIIQKAKVVSENDSLNFQSNEVAGTRIILALNQKSKGTDLHNAVLNDYKIWQQSQQAGQKSPEPQPAK